MVRYEDYSYEKFDELGIIIDNFDFFYIGDNFKSIVDDIENADYDTICKVVTFLLTQSVHPIFIENNIKKIIARLIKVLRDMVRADIKNIKIHSRYNKTCCIDQNIYIDQYLTISTTGRIYLKTVNENIIERKNLSLNKELAKNIVVSIRDFFESYLVNWYDKKNTDFEVKISYEDGYVAEFLGDYGFIGTEDEKMLSEISNLLRKALQEKQILLFDGKISF